MYFRKSIEMQALPPKYAKSITVKAPEDGVTAIKVTAVYKGNKVEDEHVTVTLTGNGQSHTFPEMTENMGTWTAVRPIHLIKGEIGDGGKQFETRPEEHCNGIVVNLAYSLHHEGDHIKLMK